MRDTRFGPARYWTKGPVIGVFFVNFCLFAWRMLRSELRASSLVEMTGAHEGVSGQARTIRRYNAIRQH